MKNRSTSQSVLVGLFVIMVLAASTSMVRAQGSPPSTNWSASRADWFNCNNWSGVCPNPLVDAHINNGGQAQIRGGSNHAAADSLTLGDSQGDSGSLLIDTDHSAVLDLATSSCRGDIYIGNGGSGTMTLKDQGYIRSRYGYVAALQNSNGNVNVKGSGSVWYFSDNPTSGCTGAGLFIGCTPDNNGVGGTATVDVSDGASIIVYRGDSDAPGITVGLSGTLTGNGNIGIDDQFVPSSKTVLVLGTLAPKAGALTINGNLDLTSEMNTTNTICHVNPQVAPQPNDKVYVSGTTGGGIATLGGRLTVVGSGTFTAGMGFNLLHADTVRNGTFFSWSFYSLSPLGSCLTPTIEYTARDVNLHIVNTCAAELEEP